MHKKSIAILAVICIASIGILFYSPLKSGVSVILGVLLNKNIELKKSDNSINVLFLGIGGGAHEGPDLSDTIIFANIQPSKNQVNLVSIPRDLWIPELEAKVNGAYSEGKEKGGKGILLAKHVVEKVIGKPVDYTVVGDFSGFVKLIDLLGGIDVEVKNSFDDYEYPIEGKENELCGHTEEELPLFATASSQLEAFPCRYDHIHYDLGMQHMDGKTALTFVRSRHAQGEEGSDFARSTRQHQVILAVKNKVLSPGTVINPVKILGIYNVLKDNIDTDIKTEEVDDFIRLAKNMNNAKITNSVLDTGDDKQKRFGLLINPPLSEEYGYQWVLIPRVGNGNFSETSTYLNCITENRLCQITKRGIEMNKNLKPSP